MTREDYPGTWRYIMVGVSMIEVLCFSGIIYGWGALVYVLKDEGFLVELCQTDNRSLDGDRNCSDPLTDITINIECSARDARFNLYFTMISSIGVLLILIVGHTFTRFGTRITRFIFITCFCIGCLCIAFADTDYPWLVCVGGILMIGSGYVFIITSTQFNMLYPGHSSTIVGLMNGMKVSSSFMQQLVKIAHDGGIPRRITYIGLFGLTCLTYLSTIYLYPKNILKDKDKQLEKTISIEVEKSKGATTLNAADKVQSNKNDSAHIEDVNVNEIDKSNSCQNNNSIPYSEFDTKEIAHGFVVKNETIISKIMHDNQTSMHKKEHKSGFLNGCYVNKGFNELPNDCETCESESDNGKNVDSSIIDKTNSSDEATDPQKKAAKAVKDDKDMESETSNSDDTQLKKYMCGYLYIFNVLWFTVIRFRTNYFYGTINPYIEEVTDYNAQKVSYYTDILSYSMACGIVTCIIVGVLYDWQRRFFINIEDVKKRRVMSSVCPLITACLVSVLLSGLVFVKEELVLYPLTVIFTFFRSLLTTVGNTFLVDMFPASIYGIIYGTRFVIANIFSLIQYALYQWSLAYPGAGVHVNIFVLCLCLTTFVHPLSILLTNRRNHNTKVTHL